jgi:transposase
MILVGKFGDHLPLNRQSAAFAREGVEIDTSTLADWVGACVVALDPVLAELRRHVFAAERLHVDDTTVPVLAKTKTRTGRLWTYVRDDQPFGGHGPPAALFDYSPSRHGEYPRKALAAWSGVMQADAFSGYNALYAEGRKPAPIVEAACWAHYLERGFMLRSEPASQGSQVTTGTRTPHYSRLCAAIRRRVRDGHCADSAPDIVERRRVHQESGMARGSIVRLPLASVGRLLVCASWQLRPGDATRAADRSVVLS